MQRDGASPQPVAGRPPPPRDSVRWPFCNLNRFFLLDSVHQWIFMFEHQIAEPAMTLSPSILIATLLSICYAVSEETLESTVDDIQRATLLKAVSAQSMLETLTSGYSGIIQGLQQQGRDCIRISLSIWVPGGLPVVNEYAVTVAQKLGAQVLRPRDITSAALKTWAQGQLEQQDIKCDFPDVSPSEVVMLSIFRLSATWARPFQRRHSEQHTLIEDERVRQISIMAQRGLFNYYECEDYKVVCIPTRGPLECLFVLPTASLGSALQTLAADYNLLFKPVEGPMKKLVLKIPLFRVDEGDDICEIMEHTLVFRRLLDVTSKYSKMSQIRTHIRHIIHKVFVSVSEEGINAESPPTSGKKEPLNADKSDAVLEFTRDFIFMVRERTGCEVLLSSVVNGANPLGNGRAAAQRPPARPSTPPRLKRQAVSSPSKPTTGGALSPHPFHTVLGCLGDLLMSSLAQPHPGTPRGQGVVDAAKLAQDLMLRRMASAQVVDRGRKKDKRQEDRGEAESVLAGVWPDRGPLQHLPHVTTECGKDQAVILRAAKGRNWLGAPAGAPSSRQTGFDSGKPQPWAEVMKRVSDVADEGVVTLSFDRAPAARKVSTTGSHKASAEASNAPEGSRYRHLAYTPTFLAARIDDDRLIAMASEDTLNAPSREWTF